LRRGGGGVREDMEGLDDDLEQVVEGREEKNLNERVKGQRGKKGLNGIHGETRRR